jgi:hypothetical protein
VGIPARAKVCSQAARASIENAVNGREAGMGFLSAAADLLVLDYDKENTEEKQL